MDVITHATLSADSTGTAPFQISGRPMVFQFDGDFGGGTLNVQMSLDDPANDNWHDVYFTGTDGALTNDITAAGLYTIAITARHCRFVLASSTDPAVIPKTAEIIGFGA